MGKEQKGVEPDYRFSLANERTFLAWMRTALALLAVAVALHQFATAIRPKWVVLVGSGSLAVVAGVLAVGGFFQWRSNQAAMRESLPLPKSRWIRVFAAFMTLIALGTMFALVTQ